MIPELAMAFAYVAGLVIGIGAWVSIDGVLGYVAAPIAFVWGTYTTGQAAAATVERFGADLA